MNGKYLLDTNIVIVLFGGGNRIVANVARADEVFLSSVVIGELFFGAYNSGRVEENINRIKDFAGVNAVLSTDSETADFYGQIKTQLKSRGTPIPENDIWIVATCLHHGLTLVSRDAHFEAIENLMIESW